jgi:hypothetical protein
MKEKKIPLDRIDDTKEQIHEAIGIPLQEFFKNFQKISTEDSLETLSEKLGFSVEKIIMALINTQKFSEAIKVLWKDKGRKEISLKEFIQTLILIKSIRESSEMLFLMTEKLLLQKLAELIKSHGNQVLIDTPDCEHWRETHPNCKGCPSDLGCMKLNLIIRCLAIKGSYEPKSFKDFLAMEKWLQERINEILKANNISELKKIFIP